MEHALEGIEAQLRGEEVTLALDVLKHAKRFHATVSFIADTGLKEATDIGKSLSAGRPTLTPSSQTQHLDERLPSGRAAGCHRPRKDPRSRLPHLRTH